VSSMKSAFIFLLVVYLVTASPQVFSRELDKTLNKEQGPVDLSDEDKEIIRNLDEIENLDWLVDTDLDLLENLDLFLTNQ
jgi:hypothetical protein